MRHPHPVPRVPVVARREQQRLADYESRSRELPPSSPTARPLAPLQLTTFTRVISLLFLSARLICHAARFKDRGPRGFAGASARLLCAAKWKSLPAEQWLSSGAHMNTGEALLSRGFSTSSHR
jgi:hypothetical protein